MKTTDDISTVSLQIFILLRHVSASYISSDPDVSKRRACIIVLWIEDQDVIGRYWP